MRHPGLRLLLGLLVCLPQPATPAVIVVDGQTDDAPGTCDLVEAIENANDDAQTNVDCAAGSGADEIQLTVDVTLTTIDNADFDVAGDNGLPQITSEIVIEGADHVIQRSSADDFRIFFVDSAGDLTLNETTVQNGLIEIDDLAVGGGIYNKGTLTLTNSTVSGNTVISSPYAFGYGGGIVNVGTTTITDSTISGNTLQAIGTTSGFASGGGIANGYFDYGIAAPELTITSSTISGNTTESYAPGVNDASSYGGGLYFYRGTANLTNSTVSGNTTISTGEEARAYGGGVTVVYTATTLTNTTVAANAVQANGTTISAAEGAGVEGFFAPAAAITLVNSILGSNPPSNCLGVADVSDGGGNLADDATCGDMTPIPDTLTGLDPLLADNSGPTLTHALLDGSTAIDNAGVCGLLTDQRGVARDDGLCDSGSFELAGGCTAPDGDTILLEMQTVDTTVVVEVCTAITAENDYIVMGPGGNLTLRAGNRVIFGNGFSVIDNGVMTVEIDPGLQLPDLK